MQDIIIKRIIPTEKDWATIAKSDNYTCFHTKEWSFYLKQTGKTPFILSLDKGEIRIGYFIGVLRQLGLKLIGAPTDGTGTFTQGLCMLIDISIEQRIKLYHTLWQWVIDNHIASYLQVCDWQLKFASPEYHELLKDLHFQNRSTLYVDTNQSESDLWNALHYKSCKYSINKAKKLGLQVQQITEEREISDFVNIHYNQLLDVCHRKGMTPQPYQKKKNMIALCQQLFPDHILMLQVKGQTDNGDMHIMASAIFCIGEKASLYFTGASNQRYMKYCPNEIMVWEAMRILSKRHAGDLIFGGVAHYKTKFGTQYAHLPMIIFSRFSIFYNARKIIKQVYSTTRVTIAKIKKH